MENVVGMETEGRLPPMGQPPATAEPDERPDHTAQQADDQTLGPNLLQDIAGCGPARAADADFTAAGANALPRHQHDDHRRHDPAEARQTQHHVEGRDGHDETGVSVAFGQACTPLDQHALDLEGHLIDADFLVDRVPVAEQLTLDGPADQADASIAIEIVLLDERTAFGRKVPHQGPFRRDSEHLVDAAARTDADGRLVFAADADDHLVPPDLLLQRLDVLLGHSSLLADAGNHPGARPRGNQVEAEALRRFVGLS